jgi:hypothetical protein
VEKSMRSTFANLSTDVDHANVFPNVVAGDSTI